METLLSIFIVSISALLGFRLLNGYEALLFAIFFIFQVIFFISAVLMGASVFAAISGLILLLTVVRMIQVYQMD
jgi:hypothetical protein